KRGRPPKKAPLPAKYQDPKTGNTWSGRGKPPKWIVGKNRERFLIGAS
ncbi:H-NS family nucleoid-associated regulatory protein, partial [Burkholderia sp. SIMBA_019]